MKRVMVLLAVVVLVVGCESGDQADPAPTEAPTPIATPTAIPSDDWITEAQALAPSLDGMSEAEIREAVQPMCRQAQAIVDQAMTENDPKLTVLVWVTGGAMNSGRTELEQARLMDLVMPPVCPDAYAGLVAPSGDGTVVGLF